MEREVKYDLFKWQSNSKPSGKEGYYLVDLKDRDYWYFENEGTLHKNLLEWKVGVLVPVAEFQQN